MTATILYGITGNYYCYSIDKTEVISVANAIGKSINSIRYNSTKREHVPSNVWVFRVKDKTTKEKLKIHNKNG